MPVNIKGKDVTALTITTGGSNIWHAEIFNADAQKMAARVNGGSYIDGNESVNDEEIWLNFNDFGGAEPLDFAHGDTINFTIDTVAYVIILDSNLVVDVPYYIDTNGTLFTDRALTIIFYGNIHSENMGQGEAVIEEAEVAIDENLAIAELSVKEGEVQVSESMAITELIDTPSHVNEVEENMGISEIIVSSVGAITSEFVKKNPPSTITWTKKQGDIT